MVDNDSSVTTTLGRSGDQEEKQEPKGEEAQHHKKDESDDDDDDDLESVNLLLTQDEWSSGDDNGDQDDDEFFQGAPKNTASATVSAAREQKKEGNITSETSSAVKASNAATSGTPPGPSRARQSSRSDTDTSHSSKSPAPCLLSPATRTLDALSQQSSQDLRYDMSQLERDANSVMMGLLDDDGSDDNANQNAAGKLTRKGKTEKAKVKAKQPAPKVNSPKERNKTTHRPATSSAADSSSKEGKTVQASECQTTEGRSKDLEEPQKGSKAAANAESTHGKDEHSKASAQAVDRQAEVRQEEDRSESTSKLSAALSSNEMAKHLQEPQQLQIMPQQPQPQGQDQPQQQPQQQPTRQQEMPPPPPRPPRHEQQEQQQANEETLDFSNYCISHVTVLTPGSFGCTISKCPAPKDLMPSAKPQQMYCRIRKLDKPSLALDLGMQVDDWFVQDDSSSPRLANYATVVALARSNVRPLNLYLVRKKTPPPPHPATKQADSNAGALDEEMSQLVDTAIETGGDIPGGTSADQNQEYRPTFKVTKVKRSGSKAAKTTSTSSKGRPKNTLSSKSDASKSDERDVEEARTKLMLPNGDKVVPFCNLCNDPKAKSKKRAVHHAYCPEHECFSNSRADKYLKNFVEGVKLGCHTCAKSYELGKPSGIAETHIVGCPCRGESVLANGKKIKRTGDASTATKKKKDTPVASNDKTTKKAKGATKKRRRDDQDQPTSPRKRLLTSKRDGKTGHFTGKSEAPTIAKSDFTSTEKMSRKKVAGTDKAKKSSPPDKSSEGPRNIRQPQQTQPAQPEIRQASNTGVQEQPTACSPKKRKFSEVERQPPSVEASSKSRFRPVDSSPALQQSAFHRPAKTPPIATNESVSARSVTPVTPDDGAPCKSKWVLCENNPWGPEGHMACDVVLITPSFGLGHYETAFASERYEMTPFSQSAKYYKTHSTPQEGLHFLRLQRDPMAMRSWGFKVNRHEFGGACLVESVDPSSPAAAAVFVAYRPDSGESAALRIHDMIVAISGKAVGGMTEQGLQVELETAGPTLSLVVSRYKYANHVADRSAIQEEAMIATMDEALNDDCHLGWIDAGVPSSYVASISGIASKALDSQLQSELPLIHHKPANNPAPELRNQNQANEPDSPPREQCAAATEKAVSSRVDSALTKSGSSLKSKFSSNQKVVRFQANSVCHEATAAKDGLVITDSQHVAPEEMDTKVQEEVMAKESTTSSTCQRVIEGYESDRESEPEQDDTNSKNDQTDDSDSDDDDGNPALGCVCGKIHGGSFVVFWIQCDSCNAWYNAARKCVGFSEEQAAQKGKWCCWACSPPEDSSESEEDDAGRREAPSETDDSECSLETKFVRKKKRQRTSDSPQKRDPNQVLPKGTVVDVDREGSHLYGGMGHVMDSYLDEDGDRVYTIKYIVENYTESNILAKYVIAKNW